MNKKQQFKVKRLSERGIVPKKGSEYAAGYDLFAGESIAVPIGSYGRIAPRSGLALKHGIDTGAGVIDSDYRGELHVLLFNHSENPFKIEIGERIAQIIIETVTPTEIKEVDVLEETERGAGGFGSTGVGVEDMKEGDLLSPDSLSSSSSSGRIRMAASKRSINELGEAEEIISGKEEVWVIESLNRIYKLYKEDVISEEEKNKLKGRIFNGDKTILAMIETFDITHDVSDLQESVQLLINMF